MPDPRVIVAAVLIGLAGCSSGPALVGRPGLTITRDTAMPSPTRVDVSSPERPYAIGAGDKLSVDVFGVEELSKKEMQADAGGRISLPLAGVIDANGKTPGEVAIIIQDRLRPYVRNPQVAVNLVETVSQTVTIDGEVREPGLYPVVGRMTLMRSVASAKGATEFAKLEAVVVYRTVNNQRFAALYDLKAIRQGVYDDPEIFANDIVVVGYSRARRVFRDLLQSAPFLTSPLVAVLDNNN